MTKIIPFLWYSEKAEEAAAFYAATLPNSKITNVSDLPADSPSGPAGSVKIVEFTLCGQPFLAMAAGPLDPFNHAISLMVECETQEEIDKYWNALKADGGKEEECGWLTDKYGLKWQITPRQHMEMMKSPDRAAAKRAAEAMLKMKKLDIATLEKAFKG